MTVSSVSPSLIYPYRAGPVSMEVERHRHGFHDTETDHLLDFRVNPALDELRVLTACDNNSADLVAGLSAPSSTIAGDSAGLDYDLSVTNDGPAINDGFSATAHLPSRRFDRELPLGLLPSNQDVTCTGCEPCQRGDAAFHDPRERSRKRT